MTDGALRLLVILPAYNEQDALPGVLRDLSAQVPEAEVLVVDDGSADRTSAVARAAGVRVLQLPFNVGVGGALRAGLLVAQREGFDAAVQCDADGQHPAGAIAHLVGELHAADIVVGARFAGAGDYHASAVRRLVMKSLALAMTRVMRTTLTDVTSGFRAFGPRAIAVLSKQMPPEYLGDTVEALAVSRQAGLRVTQVPVEMRPRQGGTASHHPVRSAIYLMRAAFMLLLTLLRLTRRER